MITTGTTSMLLSEGESTLLVAIKGNTRVTTTTSGKAVIQPRKSLHPREPHIVLAECDCGRLLLSPKGQRMSLHVNLPISEASEEEFIFYARMLYRMYLESAS